MRLTTLIILFILAMPLGALAATRSSISGRITDSAGVPLPGAVVAFPDLHAGAIADTGGRYALSNLPSGHFLVSVKMLGFASISRQVYLNGATELNFSLSETVLEQHEVIVTGTSAATEQRRSPTPIQSLTSRQMQENAATNIIDAITRVPGVQQLATGPAISKPIIRGLGGNRIITLSDGIRQEGQQWGSEHGIEIDDYNVSRVEVLKGPASLSYGSDALAGVINIISEEPAPEGQLSGSIAGGYQSVNGLGSLHGRIAGNRNGLYGSAFYTGKRAHDYSNRYDGSVFNTRFSNDNFGGTIGINRHWGSSRLSFTSFNQSLGIAEGLRDSATGGFLKAVADGGSESQALAGGSDGTDYNRAIPYQRINHHKISWVNTLYMKNGARAGLTLGFQQNDRREFEDVLAPEDPGLHFQLRTLNYKAHYLLDQRNGWQLSGGVNGMLQANANKGLEFLIPDYRLFDAGVFLIAKREIGKWSLAGGLRGDFRQISSEALLLDSLGARVQEYAPGVHARFQSFSIRYAAPSGSIGASYELNSRMTLKLNAAAGYRAPNIAELSANGVHEGAIRYEYGNRELKAEQSFQGDLGAQYTSGHLSVNAAVFYNYIRHFIYTRKLSGVAGGDSIPETANEEGFPAFVYDQTPAALYGGELFLDFHPHPLDWLHLEQTLSFVEGRNTAGTDSTRYLPNIPAGRWLSGLRAQSRQVGRFIGSAFLKVELDHFFAQRSIYSAYGTETAAPAYSLLNASLGFDLLRKQRPLMRITLTGQNLADIGYQHHLSRLRYADVNGVTGRSGIFGTGRNIGLQVAVPLSFSW